MSISSASVDPRPAPRHAGTVDVALSPALALRVNEVCDLFEAAWKGSAPGTLGPRIEDYLADMSAAALPVLVRHLVLLDIDYRRLRGEQPTAKEYGDRFPALPSQFMAQVLGTPPPEISPAPEAVKPADAVSDTTTTVMPPPFEPQLRSQRYVLRRFHAQGDIGEVWLAQDGEIGRQVALKRLRPKREGQKERFLVEAQVTGQLEHPGIVPVHDLGVDENGQPFYVMSFIHGRTLREVIEEYHAGEATAGESREVEFSRLLEVFVKICQAVPWETKHGLRRTSSARRRRRLPPWITSSRAKIIAPAPEPRARRPKTT